MRALLALPSLVVPALLAAACGARTGLRVCPNGIDADPPRLVAPLSTSFVSSHRPRLAWQLAREAIGARVELCADPDCERVVARIDADGSETRLPDALAPGVYFWRAFSRTARGLACTPSPTWELVVTHRDASVVTAWGATFDTNRDGLPDLAVGAGDVTSPGSGRIEVFRGEPDGLEPVPSVTLTPPSSTDSLFGLLSVGDGDFDGDGFSDLAVLASHGVLVYEGSPAGLGTAPSATLVAPGGARDPGDFGYAIAGIGDVNGDGYADLAISDSQATVYLALGSASGLVVAYAPLAQPDGLEIGGTWPKLASAGDVNGDGLSDLLLGYPQPDGGPLAFVYLGRADLPLAPPVPLGGGDDLDRLFSGHVGGVGDLDGDGYADVVVSEMQSGAHDTPMFVFYGGPTGLRSIPDRSFSVGGLGHQPACAGDVDGDGLDDAMLTEVGYGAHAVAVLLGGPRETTARIDESFWRGFFADAYATTRAGGRTSHVAVDDTSNQVVLFQRESDGYASTPWLALAGPDRTMSRYIGFLVGDRL